MVSLSRNGQMASITANTVVDCLTCFFLAIKRVADIDRSNQQNNQRQNARE